jgi:hypothetical protein
MMTRGRKRSLAEAEAETNSPPPRTTSKRTKQFHAPPTPSPSANNESNKPDSDPGDDNMAMDFSFDDDPVLNPSDSDVYFTCQEDFGAYTFAEEEGNNNSNTAAIVVEQLTAQPHLTRASAHAIQSHLGGQPAHVRSQVRAAVPEAVTALVLPPSGDDRLAARISQLGERERREVEQAVARREKLRGGRKIQSL